ncbi:dihydroxyacetone kinase transcriptional activator DhaS [Sporolactobacillus terrae]|uniref:Dihydroxyacetone kinase transcriptional activator DhaS n=1 Tax=Sporolactobacillus terrae TaxID=269673 RepID=A0A5K7X0S9_9BACL|nr:dihydroxyacetone kinase transcriptional activator DhaS [Sporolactobacillus terrae]BBN99599.1 dihydroxyacetone kinase transcriptional activator DhaS [Sporolactobacillus terrae]
MTGSLITKKTIATALRELLKKESFEKVTVRDIMRHCHMRRQTFYNYFKDKYELVSWIYYEEAIENIQDYMNYENTAMIIERIFTYLYENQNFYIKVLEFTSQNSLSDYLLEQTKLLIRHWIDELDDNGDLSLTNDFADFLSDFYSYAIVGVAIKWLNDSCPEKPKIIAKRIVRLLDQAFQSAQDQSKHQRRD